MWFGIFKFQTVMLSLQMLWVLPQGIFHVVTAVVSTRSSLVFLLWKYIVPFTYILLVLHPLISEEGRQCDDRADVVFV